MFNINKKDFKRIDFILVTSVMALLVIGLLVLRSAIMPNGDNIKSQVIASLLGIFSFFLIYFIDLDIFKKIRWLLYLLIIGALGATMVLGVGSDEWGANLWINIGAFSFQPSELVKVILILFLAAFIDKNKGEVNSLAFIIKYFILALIPVFLIIKQGDFGTAMVVLFIISAMFFMSGIKFKRLMTLIAIVLAVIILVFSLAFPLVWDRLDEYQQNRILNFIDPSRDVSDSGLQMERGYVAIGSGQLYGRGYMKGPMAQNRYIPEQHTDYIFPVLIEEFGFIGGVIVIGLYFVMIFRMLRISMKAPDVFSTTIVVGIAAMFFIHIFENVGMTIRLMPVTGIPLPFFSNGGTFQIVNLVAIGLVISVSAMRKPLDF
ncbi:MAG: FtsW/RodA/SpoVE family cell cycle protein [Tissierellia bacterium]|nr:FtsW/RodA/SpoVE family cell cycle protein [Tissierellia bacterium]